jgi:DNA-binding transcriptional regulator YdaS (Cro superfamily)
MQDVNPLIDKAIKYHGSQAKLAAAMGCSQQLISQLLRSNSITAEMALRIEKATEGEIKRHELRPDIWESAA